MTRSFCWRGPSSCCLAPNRGAQTTTTKARTVLITGSTDGVGLYVAERLAAQGWRVIVHGRDRARGEALVERIEQQGGEARCLVADLSSLAEVRALADAVRREDGGLDALVNNAGIGTSGARRELSADGFELRFAVNYLAGFLLTRLLLPMLASRESARIVNVSSAGQQAIDFSDVMLTRDYSGVRAYRQSKLAQILFTVDLAKELAGQDIAVNCLHPATYMNTTMVRLSGASRSAQWSKAARRSCSSSMSRGSRAKAGSISTACRNRAPIAKPTTRRLANACAR